MSPHMKKKKKKKEEKENTVFLSFADPDRKLAKALSDLFVLANEKAYFAPDDLGSAGTPEWRKEIISQIKKSHAIVPIYTRHSINRPWVLYESGAADSIGLQRFPARVSSICPADIDYLPGGSALYFDLSVEKDIENLVINACVATGDNRTTASARVRRTCREHESVVKRIKTLAKTRWVFIAGNVARNVSQPGSGVDWYNTQADYEMRLKDFCELLTAFLLDSGFSIAACPQVPNVGMHVTHKALKCLDSKEYTDPVKFRIGGIYPIDREAREIALSEGAKRRWLDHIMAFRCTYLADQEWLLVVGGNEGTQEEFEAATMCDVKTYAVPCFGGTAMRVFEQGQSLRIGPCVDCKKRDGSCGEATIKELVNSLKDVCFGPSVTSGRAQRALAR